MVNQSARVALLILQENSVMMPILTTAKEGTTLRAGMRWFASYLRGCGGCLANQGQAPSVLQHDVPGGRAPLA